MERAINKEVPKLYLGERLTIIKNKQSFSLVFPIIVLIFLTALFGILTEGRFLEKSILVSVFNQSIIIGTMATGISFVYSAGNMDISLGSAMAFAAVMGVLVYQTTGSVALLVLVPIVVGSILMLINGTIYVLFGIRTIIISIVMMQMYNAIVSKVLGPDTVSVNFALCRKLENSGFRFIAFILFFLLCIIVYHFTPVGRQLRFIGGNTKCAEQTGISKKIVTYTSFLMAGLGVGLSAVFSVIRASTVGATLGSGMGMDVMLATVLGGMSIFGGAKSNAYAGLLGALTVSVLNKGLLMYGVSPMVIQGVRGVIFLALVLMNSERPATLPSA